MHATTRIAVQTIALLVLLTPGGTVRGLDTIDDNFDDGVIDPALWAPYRRPASVPLPLLEAGGVLQVHVPACTPSRLAGLMSRGELQGDFDVWIDFDWRLEAYQECQSNGPGDPPTARWHLVIRKTNCSEYVGMDYHVWGGASREIILQYGDQTGQHNVRAVFGSSVDWSGKLRLRRESGVFSGYYWTSRGWRFLGTVTRFAEPCFATFHADNYVYDAGQDAAAFELHWDNFHAEGERIVWGQIADCNSNGVADLCEADCNANGVVDACDLANGTSGDDDADGVPDECTNCAPVVISVQPRSVEVCAGTAVTLFLSASGQPPLAYQWRRNGVGIPGATNVVFTIDPANPIDSGTYDVEVSNPCSSIISDAAVAVVWPIGTGDVNGDGVVDGNDLAAFVRLVVGRETSPSLEVCGGDMNRDGVVSIADVAPWIAAMLRG